MRNVGQVTLHAHIASNLENLDLEYQFNSENQISFKSEHFETFFPNLQKIPKINKHLSIFSIFHLTRSSHLHYFNHLLCLWSILYSISKFGILYGWYMYFCILNRVGLRYVRNISKRYHNLVYYGTLWRIDENSTSKSCQSLIQFYKTLMQLTHILKHKNKQNKKKCE